MPSVVLRRIVFVTVVVALALAVIGGTTATLVDERSVALSSSVDNDTNETVHHQYPAEYENDRDPLATLEWLSNDLVERLNESVVSISEGEFDQGRDVVGDQYGDRLEQFVIVRGEIGTGTIDDESTEVSVDAPLSAELDEDIEVTAVVTNNAMDDLETTGTFEIGDETRREFMTVESHETEELSVTVDADDLDEGVHQWSVTIDDRVEEGELTIYNDRPGDSEADEEEKDAERAFEDAADDQAEFATRVETYRETLATHEEARQNGDGERIRETVRELESLVETIDELGGSILVNYEVIRAETGEDLSEPAEELNEIIDDIEREQRVIVNEDQFVETSLEVESADETASIAEPAVVTGRLETADDSSIANEEIRLLVNNQSIDVETDENGGFAFNWRPEPTIDRGTNTITVEYVPETESEYLGSETELRVFIEQTDAEITTVEATEPVAYGDNLTVAGELTSEGSDELSAEHLDDVPVRISSDDRSLGETTVENGTFDDSVTVPANVTAGEQPVTVQPALEDRALALTETTTTVEVEETATELEFDAAAVGDEFELTGALETATGDAVANQPVTIELENETTTVSTLSDGSFGASFDQQAVPDEDEFRATARFDGSGTNLGETTSETTVTASTTEGGDSFGLVTPVMTEVSVLEIIAGIGLVTVVLGTIVVLGRQRPRTLATIVLSKAGIGGLSEDSGGSSSTAEGTGTGGSISALLSLARERREQGDTDGAVRIGHAAIRRAYDSSIENTRALTHRELYNAARRREDGEETDDHLRTVTEGYERAAFDADTVPDSIADRVLSHVSDVCSYVEESSADEREAAEE